MLNNGLRERNYGHLSGLTGDEMHEKSPEEFASLRNRVPDAPLQGGESLEQLLTQADAAMYANKCARRDLQAVS